MWCRYGKPAPGLACLQDDRDLAIQAIREIAAGFSVEDAGLLYDGYIRPYWTRDGRPNFSSAEKSLVAIADEFGVDRPSDFTEFYVIT